MVRSSFARSFLLSIVASSSGAVAGDWASQGLPVVLSDELPGGAVPGGSAQKARLVRLANTVNGVHDGRLVITYSDSNNTAPVWDPQTLEHLPRDVFTRYSDDDGKTWSSPVNISNSAGSYSAVTDHDGDGIDSPYYGDCDKPTIAASGDVLVVSWVGKYAPDPEWVWGQSGVSQLQGSSNYDDPAVQNPREVPFSAVWVALSPDGGTTWTRGDIVTQQPPLQLTHASRDAVNDVQRGSGRRWVLSWQEDPAGLQTGEAEGPGEGSSGAKGTPGTDVWYTWVSDIVADPTALALNRTPLSNHSLYNMTFVEPLLMGVPGEEEFHAATRPNVSLVNDSGTWTALVAYEESKDTAKGVATGGVGKTVQYHAFPFNEPIVGGSCECLVHGATGTTVSVPNENGRRVRFVTQTPNGVDPAVFVFWRQGLGNQGSAADIVGRVAKDVDEASVALASLLNLSSNAPVATDANLADSTDSNPLDDARAHRALLRGPFVALGYSYTRDLELAETTVLENYDFWLRRSLDGGNSWSSVVNLSELPKTENVLEPRLVGPAASGGSDPAFVVAYGTETNVNDQLGEVAVAGDISIRRTRDLGATWTQPMPFAASSEPENESQIQVGPGAAEIWAVWMKGGATNEAMFTELTNEWFTPGDLLRVRFLQTGAGVSSEFDAVHHEILKLVFLKTDDPVRTLVEIIGPIDDVNKGSMSSVVASFEVLAGKAKLAKVITLPESGRYLLRFVHLAKGLGPIVVQTGCKLPPRGRERTMIIAPDPSTLIGHWSAQLLANSTLKVTIWPLDPFGGKPGMGLELPGGESFDCNAYEQLDGDVTRYVDMPIANTGTHRLTFTGFTSKKDRLRVRVQPNQPAPGDAEIDLP